MTYSKPTSPFPKLLNGLQPFLGGQAKIIILVGFTGRLETVEGSDPDFLFHLDYYISCPARKQEKCSIAYAL